ncbi:hypothetical protein [Nonomuraea sp. MG754425]|nr:hypothetical protein [Nonomuraea sp. MG754425]
MIDADTTFRSFAKEVRWNQAYYRLARGSDFRAPRVASGTRCDAE